MQDRVEEILKIISNKAETSISNGVQNLIRQQSVSTASKLGFTIGQNLGGFSSLSSEIDDVIPTIDGSSPLQNQNAMPITQLQRNGSGINSLNKKVESSDKSVIDSIIGDTTTTNESFTDIIIAAPFPEAMAAALKKAAPKATAGQIISAVEKNVDVSIPNTGKILTDASLDSIDEALDPDFKESLDFNPNDLIKVAVGSQINSTNTLNNLVSSVADTNINASNTGLATTKNGFGSTIENAIEQSLKPSQAIITANAIKNNVRQVVPSDDIEKINNFASKGQYALAVAVLQKYSDKSYTELETEVRKINNKASKVLKEPAVDIPFAAKTFSSRQWSETTTDKVAFFGQATSPEELQAKFSAMNRETTETIIFSTGKTNGNWSSFDFHQKYNEDGVGIPFHFFIGTHGEIFYGRPLDVKSKGLGHSKETNVGKHIEESILILIEGGDNRSNQYSPDVLGSLKLLLKILFSVKPGMQVFGANEIADEYGSPYFSVSNKLNLYGFTQKINNYNPKKEPPLNQTELAMRRSEGN
ncbi:hypothetical protein OAL25_00890 [bacterium]|nr:hypothetical protein [bacterium]